MFSELSDLTVGLIAAGCVVVVAGGIWLISKFWDGGSSGGSASGSSGSSGGRSRVD